jgi:hypothetical protein
MKKSLLALAAGVLAAGVLASPAVASSGVVMPVGVNYTRVSDFDSVTGTTAEIVRIYYSASDGIPTSVGATTDVQDALNAGDDVVVSFTPEIPVESSQLTDFSLWAQSVVNGHYTGRVWVDVWHEPQTYFGCCTQAQGQTFIGDYEQFQAEAHADGLMFGPIFNTYPIYHENTTTDTTLVVSQWLPPAGDDSFIGIDTYPGDDANQSEFYDPLSVISPITNLAHTEGIPVGISETCIMDTTYTVGSASETDAEQYLEDFKNFGGSWLMYFDGPVQETPPACDISNNDDAMVPAWDSVYDYHQSGG